MTELQKHIAKWSNCRRCSLYKTKCHYVFYRGTCPCDVLFIGEAPGPTEDILGVPFIGEAGSILSSILKETFNLLAQWGIPEPRIGITNLICCYPTSDGQSFRVPTETEIHACSPRLSELIKIAKPSSFVLLGDTAQNLCYSLPEKADVLNLTHPSAILRNPDRELAIHAYKECVTNLLHFLHKRISVPL